MRKNAQRMTRGCSWLAALVANLVALPLVAQTTSGSGLADLYNSLPADQQQALMQQVGGGQQGSADNAANPSRTGSTTGQGQAPNARSRIPLAIA